MTNYPIPEKRAFLHRDERPAPYPWWILAPMWIVSAAAACAMLILIAQCSRIIFSYWSGL